MNIRSESWIELEPLRVEHGNLEHFDNYYERIKQKTNFSHIPKTIFKQWLWAHHDKEESIQNYGWLDYEKIEFTLCEWSNKQLIDIYVLESYRDYFENKASFDDISGLCCLEKDLISWKSKGTWRTPPIIIDNKSLKDKIPTHCELISPYQLVEGHTRLGYLHSMFRIDSLGKEKVAKKHFIYLMRLNEK